MAEQYDLSLRFDSDEPEFTRGVEVGLLYAQVEFMIATGADTFSRPIHTSNMEMAFRIAESFDVHVHGEEIDDDWITVIFHG